MNVLYHHRTRGSEVEGVHIRGIAHALRSLGHPVDIVSPPGVDVEKPEGPSTAPGPPQKAAPGRWSFLTRQAPELVFESIEMGYNAYALPVLAWRLRQKPYVLLYERYALFLVAGVLASRERHLPLILEVNDSAVVDRIRPLKLQAAARRVERFVWTAADAIVTITSYFRDIILETGVHPDRVHVIPNAVDEGVYKEPRDGASVRQKLKLEDRVVIGYVGAINRWRRLDLLMDAFSELQRDHPRTQLLLVGDGPDRESLAAEARARGIGPRVTLTGRVAHAEVADYLGAMDVAVIPHSNTYGSPMKLFEYMAAGRLVVAPWLPPIVSIIGEDDGGVLFPPLDKSGLLHALQRLVGDADLRARLGARAREKVLDQYLWRRHAETILDIQAHLVSEQRPR